MPLDGPPARADRGAGAGVGATASAGARRLCSGSPAPQRRTALQLGWIASRRAFRRGLRVVRCRWSLLCPPGSRIQTYAIGGRRLYAKLLSDRQIADEAARYLPPAPRAPIQRTTSLTKASAPLCPDLWKASASLTSPGPWPGLTGSCTWPTSARRSGRSRSSRLTRTGAASGRWWTASTRTSSASTGARTASSST